MTKKQTTKQKLNNKAYQKQLRRIKSLIRRAEQRGYRFAPDTIPQKPKNVTVASVRKLARLTPERLYAKAEYGGAATYGEIVPGLVGLKAERSARAIKAAETRKFQKQLFSQPTWATIEVPEPTWAPEPVPQPVPEPEPTPEPKPTQPEPAQEPEQPFEPPYKPNRDITYEPRAIISTWLSNLNQFENGESYNLLRAWLTAVIEENGEENTARMLQEGAKAGNLLTWDVVYKGDNARQYIASMLEYLPDAGVLYKEEMIDKVEYLTRLSDAMELEELWEEPE